MRWIKRGRIFKPGAHPWMEKFGILPTPVYIEQENIIRVFFGTAAFDNIGRITYLDLSADDPARVIAEAQVILMNEGAPGMFDDCGVNPSQVYFVNGKPNLFYSGYQRSYRTPYLIFSSLCELNSSLSEVTKRSQVPVLDRIEGEPFIRSAPVATSLEGTHHIWYVSAFRWEQIGGEIHHNKMLPVYCIKHACTDDFVRFDVTEAPAIAPANEQEFGFGRPWVIAEDGFFRMWYSIRSRNEPYRIGYAESVDGRNWVRKDEEVGISLSETGWDSEMICYAALLRVKNKIYLFYNGNNNGATGFGLAELA